MTWCYLPETDSAFAAEAAGSTWGSTSQSPISERSAGLKLKTTPAAPSSRDSGPDTSLLPRSGMMSPRSTPDPIADISTPCLPDTPASRSAQRGSAREPMTSATYGRMSPGSWTSWSPDGSISKTSQATYRLASIPCCETYGTWATRLRLAYSLRRKSVQRMNGSASSSWPTADTPSGGRTLPEGTTPTGITPDGRKLTVGLENAAQNWPTPMAGIPAQNGNSAAGNSDWSRRAEALAQSSWMTPRTAVGGYTRDGGVKVAERPTLEGQATIWSTPRGSDGEKGGPNMAFGAGGTPLPAQAATWPTPASRDHKGENSAAHLENGTGRLHLDQLPNAVAFLFSRPDPETPPHGVRLSDLLRIWRPLRASLIASHGRATWRRLMKARGKRRLNPLFVEWLMGWPPGHALCDCSETEFALWQRRMRGALSLRPMASGPWIWKPPAEMAETQLDMFGGEI